jgi:hypothetical protein
MILIKWLIGRFISSAWAKIAGAFVLGVGVWLGNDAIQRAKGAKQERVRIIEKTEAEGKDRNAKSANIRRKIRTSKPGAAFQRLRRDYSSSD